jgi:nitrate/nitrite transporter NarK
MTAFGIWGTVGPFWAFTTSTVSGAAEAAAIGLINSIGNLGGFAGPYIVGAIKTYTNSFAGALFFLSASLVVSGTLFLLVTAAARRSQLRKLKSD